MHVEYPHEPGRLYDCADCENGPCVCTAETAPCVSWLCDWRTLDGEFEPCDSTDPNCTCIYCIPGA